MRRKLILDTNVVLDLFVFEDPAVDFLRLAIANGKVSWLSSSSCRDELARVLDYPAVRSFFVRRGLNSETRRRALALHDQFARTGLPSKEIPIDFRKPLARCADAGDQFLIDLAIVSGADYLISKDRHVLRMAKSIRGAGYPTRILRPAELLTDWRHLNGDRNPGPLVESATD